jgi:hypothetical protein
VHYKEVFSMASLLSKAPDGRSLGGLDHRIGVKGQLVATAHIADALCVLKTDNVIAAALRPNAIPLTSTEDLWTAIAHVEMKLLPTLWPYAVLIALIERAVDLCRKGDGAELPTITDPFTIQEFQPRMPTVGGLADVEEISRLCTCERLLFTETVVFLVGAGVEEELKLLRILRGALIKWEKLDVLALSEQARDRVVTWKSIAQYLELLLDSTCGGSYEAPYGCSPQT